MSAPRFAVTPDETIALLLDRADRNGRLRREPLSPTRYMGQRRYSLIVPFGGNLEKLVRKARMANVTRLPTR